MKKYIIALLLTITSFIGASAQTVVVRLGSPCVHTHYIEHHAHCVPPPPMRAPRYYYAPVPHEHHNLHHHPHHAVNHGHRDHAGHGR